MTTPAGGPFGGSTGLRARTYRRDKQGKFSSGGESSAEDFEQAVAGAASGKQALAVAMLPVTPTTQQDAALGRMGGDGAYVVNADLRTSNGAASTERNAATVTHMDSLMQASPLDQDVVIYRRAQIATFGEGAEGIGNLAGLSWRDHAYVSTSVEPRVRMGGALNMRIVAPAGTPGFSHRHLDSDEILLGRGLTFEVVADHRVKGDLGGDIDVVVHP